MSVEQDKRKRLYMYSTWLVDDNGDIVPGTDKPLACTFSEVVGQKALDVFKASKNGQVTLVHPENTDRFSSNVAEVLSASEPVAAQTSEPAESSAVESILNMVAC